MCGFRASKERIAEFVREHKSQIPIRKSEPPPQVTPRVPTGKSVSMDELFRKGILIEGSKIFADYRHVRYEAEIISPTQIRLLSDGSTHTSLSLAGIHITHYNVNGWLFWKCNYKGREYTLDRVRKEDP